MSEAWIMGRPPRRLTWREWFRALFAWREVERTAVWLYEENAISGARRAVRIATLLIQPVHRDWLDGGSWERPRPAPPSAFLRALKR